MVLRLAVLLVLAGLAGGCRDDAATGHRLYAAHGCAVCHGPDGRGDGPAAHTLTPPPHDFADSRSYVQGPSAAAIATSIRNGVGNMPAFRDISDDDAHRLAAWIVSLQKH